MSRRRKPQTRRPGPKSTRHTKTAPCGDCGETCTIDTAVHAMAVHDCESGDWFLIPHSTIDYAKTLPEWQVLQTLRAPGDWAYDIAKAIDNGHTPAAVISAVRAAGDDIPARREQLRRLAASTAEGEV